MNYAVMVVTLSVVVLMLVYTQKLIHFLNLLNLNFKKNEPKIVEPAFVDRDILVELAKIEKFLYKQRFTRRLIVEHIDDFGFGESKRYTFYYYQLIDGIHAFIEATSKSGNISFKINFDTFYDSKNICVSSNSSKYLLNVVPPKVYYYEHKKYSQEELYNAHLEERNIATEVIYKQRLLPNELINYEVKKEQEAVRELVKNGYAKYTDEGYKLLPTFKLWNSGAEVSEYLDISKSSKAILFKLILAYGVILLSLVALFFYLMDAEKINPKAKIEDPKIELSKFNKRATSLQGLTIALSTKDYNLTESMNDIDRYLKKSHIKRYIGAPIASKVDSKNLPCEVPKDLEKMYKWHNGIELLVPSRDFFSFNDFKTSYNNFKSKIKDTNNSNMVFVFASKYEYRGLAYSCNKSGLYEYSIYSHQPAHKEFYNFKHFLKIVAEAYKQGAFYDDIDMINVDLKKFFKIYREHLSRGDKHRYELLVEYLKDRAKAYKHSSKELKLALLEEISNTYDSKLISSAKIYLNDSNQEVVSKAIEALGNIGNKSIVPALVKYLKSKNMQYKDFALLALAKIVNNQDRGLVEYIAPILNDKSVLARISAYEVLTRIGDEDSLVKTRENFAKEKPAVKLAMIKLFANVGDKEDAKILKEYLKEVKEMDYSKEIKEPARGSDPHPKILEYEILKALKAIELRNKN